jgi:rapamycin-insensitive companion of mTOR
MSFPSRGISSVCMTANRRTAFFVLGLISGTVSGVQILDELGWDSVMTTMGAPTGLCLPRDPSKFLSLPPVPSTLPPEPLSLNVTDQSIHFPPFDSIDTQILQNVTNMLSVVHAKEATRTLLKLKQRYPARFKRKFVWLGMLRCLEKWNYSLPVRRFLFDFFGEKGMIRAIGRVETGGESEGGEDSEDEKETVERKPMESAGLIQL